MSDHDNLEYTKRSFAHFRDMCRERSPLYHELAGRCLGRAGILTVAARAQRGQPPVNMLFAAVNYLLLSGADHSLRDYYPSLGGIQPVEKSFPAFDDFCEKYQDQISELVSTRRVQTNEVSRSGMLFPAFEVTSRYFERIPLYLIEIGPSLGLHLYFDHYRYEYSDGATCGLSSSPLIRVEVKGDRTPPIPPAFPTVSGRTGIDMSPIDIMDDDSVRWVEALIWADQTYRVNLFRRAVATVRKMPPFIHKGDGLALLSEVIEKAPSDSLPCVFHSHAIYQMTIDWRDQFQNLLSELGTTRNLAHVSLEWLGEQKTPQLYLTTYKSGASTKQHLAECHHHGDWIDWLDDH